MSLPDLINGVLEGVGGFFIALSVIKLHRAKVVSGVSGIHVAFFSFWGFWNLFYYPHLDQWLSFWGGVLLVAVNCVWLAQIFYYTRVGPSRMPSMPDEQASHRAAVDADYASVGGYVEKWPATEMTDDQFGGFNRTYGRTPRYRHNDK